MLAISTLLIVLDNIAAGVDEFADIAAIVEGRASADVSTLSGLDVSVKRDLVPVFYGRMQLLSAPALAAVLQGQMIQRAFDRHYGASGIGDLNEFLKQNDARVHPNLRTIGMQIDSRNAFAPTALDPVATYEVDGAGLGHFAAVIESIDTSLFGNVTFEAVVDAMGAADLGVRIAVRDFDGTITEDVVTLPADAVAGDVVAIAPHGVAITSIESVSGGTAGDTFHVRSIVERVI